MNKNVLIGITGSIAAYKAAELIRCFKKNNDNVKVVSTKSALLFIGEKTLETLSNNPVYVDMFQKRAETEHISLADWADVFVIAPIDANTISKVANGVADNLLTSVICAYIGKNKPLFMAPAMNEGMWKNPFVQKNINSLKNVGIKVVEPISGELACGYFGLGKMESPENIFKRVYNRQDKGKIVITAGGTREYIDPVRFITNASSGKTGIALADEAYNLGYEVSLISTFEIKKPYKVTVVNTAQELEIALKKEFQEADYLIMAAAVSDFRVINQAEHKISKNEIKNGSHKIELGLNPDILKSIVQIKKPKQTVIGFSLTTENPVNVGIEKLRAKKCDYIIANGINSLNGDNTEVWVIDKDENIQKIEMTSKLEAAKKILEIVL